MVGVVIDIPLYNEARFLNGCYGNGLSIGCICSVIQICQQTFEKGFTIPCTFLKVSIKNDFVEGQLCTEPKGGHN